MHHKINIDIDLMLTIRIEFELQRPHHTFRLVCEYKADDYF